MNQQTDEVKEIIKTLRTSTKLILKNFPTSPTSIPDTLEKLLKLHNEILDLTELTIVNLKEFHDHTDFSPIYSNYRNCLASLFTAADFRLHHELSKFLLIMSHTKDNPNIDLHSL